MDFYAEMSLNWKTGPRQYSPEYFVVLKEVATWKKIGQN